VMVKGSTKAHNSALKAWETRRQNGNDKGWSKGLTRETDERVAAY